MLKWKERMSVCCSDDGNAIFRAKDGYVNNRRGLGAFKGTLAATANHFRGSLPLDVQCIARRSFRNLCLP